MDLVDVSFRERVYKCWKLFEKEEGVFRKMIDEKAGEQAISEKLDKLLSPAFSRTFAEVGFNGEKYELALTLEGDWTRLFKISYFADHAPQSVLEHWDILIGRQVNKMEKDFCIEMGGNSISSDDVLIWTDWENDRANLSIFCPGFVPLLKGDQNILYSISYILLDQAIGELSEMKYVGHIEFLAKPRRETALKLENLLQHFSENLSILVEELMDADQYMERYSTYQMQPDENSKDGSRRDVFGGSTCFFALLDDFFRDETYLMDSFEEDGVSAGYIAYPLDWAVGNDRGAQILDFRDALMMHLEQSVGDSFKFIGGATGVEYGYLDFIAWDLKEVLECATKFFASSKVSWAGYHSFRQKDSLNKFSDKFEKFFKKVEELK